MQEVSGVLTQQRAAQPTGQPTNSRLLAPHLAWRQAEVINYLRGVPGGQVEFFLQRITLLGRGGGGGGGPAPVANGPGRHHSRNGNLCSVHMLTP